MACCGGSLQPSHPALSRDSTPGQLPLDHPQAQGCTCPVWSSCAGVDANKDRRRPRRALWAGIQESQVPRAASRNGPQRLGGHFCLTPQSPPGPSSGGGGGWLQGGQTVHTEVPRSWCNTDIRSCQETDKCHLLVGVAVGTAILQGNLAVTTEISDAHGSYDPEIIPSMATPGKNTTVSKEVCADTVIQCDLYMSKNWK